jgi:hypothetical protein
MDISEQKQVKVALRAHIESHDTRPLRSYDLVSGIVSSLSAISSTSGSLVRSSQSRFKIQLYSCLLRSIFVKMCAQEARTVVLWNIPST